MSVASEARDSSAVVLQHRDDAPGGLLIDVLRDAGFRSSTVRVDRGEPLPDPASLSLAVTLGCDGAVDERSAEWSRPSSTGSAKPTGQARPCSASGSVRRRSRWRSAAACTARPRTARLGVDIELDPWVDLPGPWLAWQEHVIRLPPTARLLAHDPVGPQAYMANGHLGVQFHPEITPKILCGWVTAGQPRASTARVSSR